MLQLGLSWLSNGFKHQADKPHRGDGSNPDLVAWQGIECDRLGCDQ